MRIISKFKDYYDYVEFLYSPEGGDPSNTYNRREIAGGSVNVHTKDSLPILTPKLSLREGRRFGLPWKTMWCCVCGKLYLLVAPQVAKGSENALDIESLSATTFIEKSYSLITADHPILKMARLATTGFPFGKERDVPIEKVLGIPNEICKEISKEIGEPIFLIGNFYRGERYRVCQTEYLTVEILPSMPNLGKLGFASAIPAEQMYQNVATFLGYLKGDPDLAPPVSIGDGDRLEQKGFDKVTSFRGVGQKRKRSR